MNVLVVGGAGYVGCVLVRELLERGHRVTVYDRLYFTDEGLNSVRSQINLKVGDMRQITANDLYGIDAVVNLGGLSNDPTAEYNPEANREMNMVSTEILALICREVDIRRFIFASSASIYDTGIISDETDDIVQDEETPVNPTKPYSICKHGAEKTLLEMAGENFSPVILRKGTIFGWSPRMRYDLVVNTMVKDALSKGIINVHAGGEMWRPLVAVRDVARAYAAVLEAPEEKVAGQIFNVSCKNYRISELALWVKHVLGRLGIHPQIAMSYGSQGVRSYRISNQKLKRVLGFEYQHDIEHAIREMVERVSPDFENPLFYNIQWMKFLEAAKEIIDVTGEVF